jgi:hypothetical protein
MIYAGVEAQVRVEDTGRSTGYRAGVEDTGRSSGYMQEERIYAGVEDIYRSRGHRQE